MSDYYQKLISDINTNVDELSRYGITLPRFETLYAGNDNAVIKFLDNQYIKSIEKHHNTIAFNKSVKVVKKNPQLGERFTFKKDSDITKMMQGKIKKDNALMFNFINTFTKINILDKDIKIVFAHKFLDKNKSSEITALKEVLSDNETTAQ